MLWSGRFERPPAGGMFEFSVSADVDMRLLPQDVAATKAHARVLEHAGLLEEADLDAIDRSLNELLEAWERGKVVPGPTDEDVHSLIERHLTETLGDLGRRIHAGRSRNDLVATDLRLWCREAAAELAASAGALTESICSLAEAHTETIMPGYTHLQRAQPVSLGFHLLAHGFGLARDVTRFRAACDAADVSALGAGALAGNGLGLDPYVATRHLGLTHTFDNAMDAVSDRDFAADLLYACALCCVHLSRLGEEIVLWTSSEFGFARLADEWSTGSSMMPQKRNPDAAELTRGRAAGAIADLNGLLVLLKGIPLAYDRDLQEDKAYVFRAADRTLECTVAVNGMLGALRFDRAVMAEAARGGAIWATDLAEALVARGVPFRTAHEEVGRLVARLERTGLSPGAELLAATPPFVAADAYVIAPEAGMRRRDSRGGTAPNRVTEQIEQLRLSIKPPEP